MKFALNIQNCVFIIIMLLSIVGVSAGRVSSEVIPDQVRKGVVKIITDFNGNRRIGTGFVVAKIRDGKVFIVTVTHVVKGVNSVIVRLYGYEEAEAEVLDSRSEESDIGLSLLLIKDKNVFQNVSQLSLSERDTLSPNIEGVVFGFPENLVITEARNVAFQGKSEQNKLLFFDRMGERDYERFSGGPIVDIEESEVIGIVREQKADLIHAIPSSIVRNYINALVPLDDIHWMADQNTMCKVWITDTEKIDKIAWTGECRNNIAEGRGILKGYLKKSSKYIEYFSYEGQVHNGRAHGEGVLRWHTGDRFEGEFRNGRYYNGSYIYAHNNGFYTYTNGERSHQLQSGQAQIQ